MNQTSELCPKCGEHCYAKLLNSAGAGAKVFDEKQFCSDCKAHLAASGICMNGCHLSADSMRRFQTLFSGNK